MQESIKRELLENATLDELRKQGHIKQEFFLSPTDAGLFKSMDKRADELDKLNHTIIKRIKIGRNRMCPCGSGLKFKKCCVDKAIETDS